MTLHHFILRVKHDRGVVNIHTSARDVATAKQIVMNAERCPERAILWVRCRDVDGYEMALTDLTRRITISPAPAAIRRDAQRHGGRTTRFSVQTIDSRWRRAYRAKGGAAYVYHAGLRVLVQLPSEDLG